MPTAMRFVKVFETNFHGSSLPKESSELVQSAQRNGRESEVENASLSSEFKLAKFV